MKGVKEPLPLDAPPPHPTVSSPPAARALRRKHRAPRSGSPRGARLGRSRRSGPGEPRRRAAGARAPILVARRSGGRESRPSRPAPGAGQLRVTRRHSAAPEVERRGARAPAPETHALGQSRGSASWTGVDDERKRSAIHSRPPSASARAGSGPARRDPAELELRQPAHLREPAQHEGRNAAIPEQAGKRSVPGPGKVTEHFVRDDRQRWRSQNASSSRRSSASRHEPVGWLGCTTITARARGPSARSSESRSTCQDPS